MDIILEIQAIIFHIVPGARSAVCQCSTVRKVGVNARPTSSCDVHLHQSATSHLAMYRRLKLKRRGLTFFSVNIPTKIPHQGPLRDCPDGSAESKQSGTINCEDNTSMWCEHRTSSDRDKRYQSFRHNEAARVSLTAERICELKMVQTEWRAAIVFVAMVEALHLGKKDLGARHSISKLADKTNTSDKNVLIANGRRANS